MRLLLSIVLLACAAGTACTPSPTAVRLHVGDDFQAVVDAHPPGTRYRVATGVHRLQQVEPQDGDVFVGDPGAVLSGARDLSTPAVRWQRDGDHWFVDGQTQEGDPHGEIVAGGRELDRHPEEVWVADRRYEPVASRAALQPGTFFFDYAADRIWLAEDPARLGPIETSVARFAFSGDAVDVTVADLIVERYASPAQEGAVGGRDTRDWVLRHLTVRANHGAGVRLAPGMVLVGSAITDNGQIGVVGKGVDDADGSTGAAVTVTGNEIARNGALHFDPQWEGGGAKFARMAYGVVARDNWVHDNAGHGLWFDLEVYSATASGNLVEGNALTGIFYEISHGPHPLHGGHVARIVGNEVRGNGTQAGDQLRLGAGIFVENSHDVEITGNHVHGNESGIFIRQVPRDEAAVDDIAVHDNVVVQAGGCTGFSVEGGYIPAEQRAYAASVNVSFQQNRYGPLGAAAFCWADGRTDLAGWQGLGHDLDAVPGQANDVAAPDLSHVATRTYGAP